jgi:hypothetical protein
VPKGIEMDIFSCKALTQGASWSALLAVILMVCPQCAKAQGASPESAASLFPGGGLVSYDSVFATRGVFASPAGNMPSTDSLTSLGGFIAISP